MDAIWEQLFSTQEWGKYPPEHVIRFVARNFYKVPDRSKVRILDVGSGPGANLWYIAREGFDAYAVDGSPSGAHQAQERLKHEELTATIQIADFCDHLPFDQRMFDAAIDNFSICSNPRDKCEQALHNVQQVLKPGGLFLSCWFSKKTTPGALDNRGFCLFVDEDDLLRLFSSFHVQMEHYAWTSQDNVIDQIIVTAHQ